MISEILYSYFLSKNFTFENYRLIGRLLLLDENCNKNTLQKVKNKYLAEKSLLSIQLYTIKRNIQSEFLESGMVFLKKYNGNTVETDFNGRYIFYTFKTKTLQYKFKINDSTEVRKRFFIMLYNYIMVYNYKLALFTYDENNNYYSKDTIMKCTCHPQMCNELLW